MFHEIVVKFVGDDRSRVVKVPEGTEKEEVEKYEKRPDVVYAELAYIVHACQSDF